MTTDHEATRVERAAKAMYDQSPEMWFSTQMIPYPLWDKAPVYVKAGVRIMARAALEATGAAPSLDDLLDSVHDFALVYSLWWDIEAGFDGDDRHEGQWCARIEWPLAERDIDALRDAVAKAKGESR